MLAAIGWEAERETVATVNAPVTAALVAALDPQPDDIVLDLAGGTGDLVEALAGRVARIVATDLSPVMVEAARKRGIANAEHRVDGHAGDRPPGRERRRRRLAVRLHARPRSRAGVPRDAPRAPSRGDARVRDVGAREAEPLGDGLRAAPDRAWADGAARPGRARPVRARRAGADRGARSGCRLRGRSTSRRFPSSIRFESWDDYRRVVTSLAASLRATLEGLDDGVRAEIDDAARVRLEPFRGDDGYVIPGVSLVTRAG